MLHCSRYLLLYLAETPPAPLCLATIVLTIPIASIESPDGNAPFDARILHNISAFASMVGVPSIYWQRLPKLPLVNSVRLAETLLSYAIVVLGIIIAGIESSGN